MANVISTVGKQFEEPELDDGLKAASKTLGGLIDEDSYLGEVFSLGYEQALVQIHDYHWSCPYRTGHE